MAVASLSNWKFHNCFFIKRYDFNGESMRLVKDLSYRLHIGNNGCHNLASFSFLLHQRTYHLSSTSPAQLQSQNGVINEIRCITTLRSIGRGSPPSPVREFCRSFVVNFIPGLTRHLSGFHRLVNRRLSTPSFRHDDKWPSSVFPGQEWS